MAQHNVLLVCGSGASSGFMAANIRKAVKARGLDMKVAAKSESAVEDCVDEIDCVMAGPISRAPSATSKRSATVIPSRSPS